MQNTRSRSRRSAHASSRLLAIVIATTALAGAAIAAPANPSGLRDRSNLTHTSSESDVAAARFSLATMLSDQLASDDKLTAPAINRLAAQIAAMAPALTAPTSSEYEALVESWGGRFRYAEPADGLERMAAEQRRDLWPSLITMRRIEFFAPKTATAVRLDNGQPNAHRHMGQLPPGGASGVMSSFVFPADPDDLVADGAPIAEVSMKAVTADGVPYDVAFVMVWWSEGDVWIPFRASFSGGPKPRPGFMF